jgi:UPF0755 protein
MDIKPSRPFRKQLTNLPTPHPRQAGPGPTGTAPKTDDVTSLKVPEELLKPGAQTPLIPSENPKKKSRKKWWILGSIGVVIVLAIAAVIGWFWWYNDALQAPSSTSARIRVTIEQGSTPSQIADALQQKGVIKNSTAFQLLVKQSNDRDKLQAGAYLFSPTQSAREVLSWLVEGKVDSFNVTILPGQTLAELKTKLEKDGYTAAEIDAAFAKKYDHPLLASKPDSVNLEGYIYPETYQITSETTVEQLLTRTFDEFYAQIQAKGLQKELSDKGFNLHQGITLASIVAKEASHVADRKQVAQVFEKRLHDGIQLGSDVTFMYAAALTGQTASPGLDSPYNTRKYTGLPPGAIANFTIDALQAVAEPASGDYVYFVAGDDGTVYFARTEAEHEQNIKQYCTKLCNE